MDPSGAHAPAFDVGTVDVSPFLADPASPAGDKAARDLGGMLEQAGFAVITGHGVPATLIELMEATSREFFALPVDEKMRVVWPAPDILRGYQPILADARYPSTEGQSANLVETLMINQLDPPQDTSKGSDEERHWRSPNLWPERPAYLRPVWEQYYRRMESLGDHLMAMCARALGLPDDWFADKFARHFSNLVANHYPAQPDPPEPGQVRNAAHTDHGSLTLLYRDNVPGLQVHHEARWWDVPWLPDSFLINIGDMIARWTNGRWRATPHRVVNPPRELAMEPRLSIGFFQQPNPDLMIEPAPQLVTPSTPARYRPVHCGQHVMAKELRHQRTGAIAT